MEKRAAELEQAAAESEAAAQRAAGEMAPKLSDLAQKQSGAAQAARAAQEALDKAAHATAGKQQEAGEATERALAALDQALEDEKRLGPALAESQNAASERAERLQRGVEALPKTAAEAKLQDARDQLAKASEAMRSAGDRARDQKASEATQSANEASKALESAKQALGEARAAAAQSQAKEGGSQASQLSQEQQALAQEAGEAGKQAEQGSMNAESKAEVQKSLDQAQQAMERAAEEIRSGQSSSAAKSQDAAREALSQARQSASRGVEPKTPEQKAKADELAKAQEAIQRELLELATRNKQRPGAEAQPNIERAGQRASEAKGSLDEGDLSQAQQEEQQVQRELEDAQKNLEREEDQYQRLRQDELLFRITEEVDSLLKTHQAAMKETREIDAAREGGDRPSRAQRLRLKRIAQSESSLGTRSGEIATAIAAEQSIVFAETLTQMQQDLGRCARDLDETGDWQTGDRVQTIQQDVEERAQWLLEALKEERKRRQEEQQQQQQQQGQQQQEQQQKDRLVPDAAELKLLRRLDVDVIERVNRLLDAYPELSTKEVDPLVLEDIQRLAERHERVTKLFAAFRERLGLPDPTDQ
jgi:hypothetical protein